MKLAVCVELNPIWISVRWSGGISTARTLLSSSRAVSSSSVSIKCVCLFDPGLGLAMSTLLFGIGPAPELAVISDSNSTKFTPLCTTTVYSFSMLDYS